jgi:hypothetical protein
MVLLNHSSSILDQVQNVCKMKESLYDIKKASQHVSMFTTQHGQYKQAFKISQNIKILDGTLDWYMPASTFLKMKNLNGTID